jgi:hypothetical protein
VAAVAITLWGPWQPVSLPAPLRLSVELGADVSLTAGPGDATIISPNGAVIAFVARKAAGGSPQLYVRRFSELQPQPLPETEDATVRSFRRTVSGSAFSRAAI